MILLLAAPRGGLNGISQLKLLLFLELLLLYLHDLVLELFDEVERSLAIALVHSGQLAGQGREQEFLVLCRS